MADEKSRKRKKGEKKEKKKDGKTVDDVELYKHYETFYEAAPPGYVQVEKEKPEDCIPDLPENEQARGFLANAPTKGLWMPLGKEVKVMKCWRCKSYGHRTGDRECPMFTSGNQAIEKFRMAHEDPMHDFIVEKKKTEKEQRIEQLKALLDEPTTSESDSSDSSSDSHSRHKKHKKLKHKHRVPKKDSERSEKKPNHEHKKEKRKDHKKRKHKDHHCSEKRHQKDSKHNHKRKKHRSHSSSFSDSD